MTSTEQVSLEETVDKGLKSGALGLVSTTIIATASVAPAYSIAATLVFVVGAVALQSPAVAVQSCSRYPHLPEIVYANTSCG